RLVRRRCRRLLRRWRRRPHLRLEALSEAGERRVQPRRRPFRSGVTSAAPHIVACSTRDGAPEASVAAALQRTVALGGESLDRAPRELARPDVAVLPAAHRGERHAQRLREPFLREPDPAPPGADDSAGLGWGRAHSACRIWRHRYKDASNTGATA